MFRHFVTSAVIFAGIAACSERQHVLTRMERLTAEIGARGYGESAGTDFVACFATDTNADGFITCTVKARGSNDLQALACNYREGSPGCKRLPYEGREPVVAQ